MLYSYSNTIPHNFSHTNHNSLKTYHSQKTSAKRSCRRPKFLDRIQKEDCAGTNLTPGEVITIIYFGAAARRAIWFRPGLMTLQSVIYLNSCRSNSAALGPEFEHARRGPRAPLRLICNLCTPGDNIYTLRHHFSILISNRLPST